MILNIQLKVARFKIIMQSVIKGKNLISKTVSPIRKFQFIREKQNSIILIRNITSTNKEGGGVGREWFEETEERGGEETHQTFLSEKPKQKNAS